jgi:hypothetical protein
MTSSRTRHEIRDATGVLVAVHVRIDEPDGTKRLLWERPGGETGLGDGLGIGDLPLYGTERIGDWAMHRPVIIVEGEKAAQALVDAGICALGTVTGASATPGPHPLAELTGRHVILWPDNDDVGRSHMKRIARLLRTVAVSLRWAEWSAAPPHGDAADLLATGTVEAVWEVIDAAEAIDAAEPVTTSAATSADGPRVKLDRLGPTYIVVVEPPGLTMTFRDVRTDGELAADVSIAIGGHHLFRTTSTLSLTTRDRLAKTAAEFANASVPVFRQAVFAAVEAVLAEEETLSGEVDLRVAPITGTGSLYVARPLWENGPSVLVAPGDSGKSTFARAVAVSVAGNLAVIPGVEPSVSGPILYVAGEDAASVWHARSVESICRGIGVDRSSLAHPIVLFDSAGKPIHRIARAIAERAADFVGVVLDPLSAFLAAGDQVRDRDNLFWRSVDTIGRPAFINAHPNLAQSRRWAEADGRIAGSELNRDRTRLCWAVRWKDEPAVAGTSFRRYVLEDTKRNHGESLPSLAFAVSWEFGVGDDDPGTVRFLPSEPFRATVDGPTLTRQQVETLTAYKAGATTPVLLAAALNLNANTAKSRLTVIRERGLIEGEGGEG